MLILALSSLSLRNLKRAYFFQTASDRRAIITDMFEEFILAAQQDGVDLKFALLHDSLYFTKQAHAQVLTPVHFRCRGHRWTATVTHHVAGYTHDSGARNLVYFIDITLPMDAMGPRLLSEDAEKARIQQEQEQQEEEEEEGQALLGECMSEQAVLKLLLIRVPRAHLGHLRTGRQQSKQALFLLAHLERSLYPSLGHQLGKLEARSGLPATRRPGARAPLK